IGDHAHYVNSFDGTGWAGWTPVPGGGTTNLPDAAVSFQDRAFLFAVGATDHYHYFNMTSGNKVPRYNQVFRKATHNSYWVNGAPDRVDNYAACRSALFRAGRFRSPVGSHVGSIAP